MTSRDFELRDGRRVYHRFPLEEAPAAYEAFQRKRDGIVKPVLIPVGA